MWLNSDSLSHYSVILCDLENICEIHHVALHDTSATSSQRIGYARLGPNSMTALLRVCNSLWRILVNGKQICSSCWWRIHFPVSYTDNMDLAAVLALYHAHTLDHLLFRCVPHLFTFVVLKTSNNKSILWAKSSSMGNEIFFLMQVTDHLARDPHCIIIVPKIKKINKTESAGCTVADELSPCVPSSWETWTTVFLLWLTPPWNRTLYFHVKIPISIYAPYPS